MRRNRETIQEDVLMLKQVHIIFPLIECLEIKTGQNHYFSLIVIANE